MRRLAAFLFAVGALPLPLRAQSESALRAAFEGKLVSVKVGMPGTEKGIDVFPLESTPVNWRQVAERIKDFGTSLKMGDQVMVTKVVVKKDSHIEFQLGGGGWGTFWDSPGTSSTSARTEGVSQREKDLEKEIKEAPGPTKRKELERELRSVRDSRERENQKAKAEAQQANALHQANLRAKREQSGSRFNIRFRDGIPSQSLTPEGVMAALAEYVDFSASGSKAATASGAAVAAPGAAPNAGAPAGGSPVSRLRKGLTIKEVEDLLGPATTAGEETAAGMTVMKRGYVADGMKVSTSFVNGVLVDFAITPR